MKNPYIYEEFEVLLDNLYYSLLMEELLELPKNEFFY